VIADWMLERYRLGELDAAARARVDTALERDPSLRAKLEALGADDAATLAAHPPRVVAARVQARAAVEATPSRRGWLVPSVVLALFVAVVGARVLTQPEDLRLKGDGATLRLFRQAGKDPERLADRAQVRPGDVVQVAFDAADAAYLVVVSVDGAGHATLHWPLDGDARVKPGLKAVPAAFELDDAPGFERFFLITSPAALSIDELLNAASRAGRTAALQVPASVNQRSLLLNKVLQ
jgi:Domain of unknown function (DUF4384)